MSNANNEEQKSEEQQRPLGAVLGWLNLSPTLPNTQDNMAGATAGWYFFSVQLNITRYFRF